MKSLAQLVLVAVVLIAGCSSSIHTTTPFNSANDTSYADDSCRYSPIISHATGRMTAYQGVFGAWQVEVDLKTLEARILPSRNAQAIGSIFDADLSQFLTVSPCANCLQIGDIWLDYYEYGNIKINFRLKHPFSNITARPDLHGFDVRAIIIAEEYPTMGSYPDIKVMRPDGTEDDASLNPFMLLNADGYTSHFDELCTDERYFMGGSDVPGSLNPFLRFYEDYATPPFDPTNPVGNNVMKVGADYDERTGVFLPMEGFEILGFYLIADVSYGQSATFANRSNPQYYIPAFHRTEPVRVEYWIENNSMSSSNPTATAELVVQVLDWQQGAMVDPSYPDPLNLSGIPESSNVSQLELSIPSLMAAKQIVTTPESGTGIPTDPLQYRFTVNNEAHNSGVVMGLLAVRDELYGSVAPSGRIPIPVSPSGFPYETRDIRDYTLYEIIRINIPSDNPSRFNEELTFMDYNKTYAEGRIVLCPAFFMDPGKTKFRYEWDFNYDGVTFDVDGTGLPSPEIDYVTPGTYTLGFRVKTNSVPRREYTYSIPIIYGGIAFNGSAGAAAGTQDVTSEIGSPSMIATSENIYLAYSSSLSGEDDIWLTISDLAGNIIQQVDITSDYPGTCQNPTIVAIESGAGEGLYVVFEKHNGTNWGLFSTYGNLDGSGFSAANIRTVDSGMLRSSDNPNLINLNGKFYLYYESFELMTGDDIRVASSEDYAQTWALHGIINNPNVGIQQKPTACYIPFSSTMVVAWQDNSDLANRGWDIKAAFSSSNPYTFDPSINLSTTIDNTNEEFPCLTAYKNVYAMAYLSRPEASLDSDVCINMYYYYDPTVISYRAQYAPYSCQQGPPSISFLDFSDIIFSFMSYDTATTTMKLNVNTLKFASSPSSYREEVVYSADLGTSNLMRKPCIYTNRLYTSPSGGSYNWFVIESAVAWTTYEDGYSVRVDPENLYFGNVDMLGFWTKFDDYH
jgi:hypothetical protein